MPVKGGHLRMAVACWWLWLLFAQFVAATNRTFYIQDNRFYLDRNQSLQIISGRCASCGSMTSPTELSSNIHLYHSVHYFRIHPAYWRDRLTKLRALGLNTITTCMHRGGMCNVCVLAYSNHPSLHNRCTVELARANARRV